MKSYNERVAKNVLRYESNIFGIEYRRFMLLILSISLAALLFKFTLYGSILFLLISFIFIFWKIHGEVAGTVAWHWLVRRFSRSEGTIRNTYALHEMEGTFIASIENEAAGILEIGSEQFHSIPPGDLKAVDESIRILLNKIDCSIEFVSIPQVLDPAGYLPDQTGEIERDYAELLEYAFRDVYYFKSFAVMHSSAGTSGFQSAALKIMEEMEKLKRDIAVLGFTARRISSRHEFEEIFSNIV